MSSLMTLSGRWHRSTGRRFWISVLAMSLLAAMLPAWAAKPAPKPAPTCSGTLGPPALAFFWDYRLHVGNADGSCALALAPVAPQYTPPAFAYTGTRYRIVWIADNRDEVKRIAQLRFVIKMVEFTMSNGNVVESRPLAVKELWRDPVTTSESSLSSLSIDSSGERVIFTRRYAGATELKRIDLASCAPGCAAPTTVWIPEADTTASGGGTNGYFDVVRLGPNCTIVGTEACIDSGDATVVAEGIWAGWLPRSAEWTPAGNLLRVIDPPEDDIYGNNHIETIYPKTGDRLHDHGYGVYPAGLKQ